MRHQILYFGNAWFTENRTSSHHIARRLARSHELHYFECPGLRAPGGSKRDLGKAFRQLARAWQKPVRSGNVTVRPLLQIPFHRFALVRRLNQLIMRLTVRRVMRQHGIASPITWFTVPHAVGLAGRLNDAATVYYCIDDYSAIPGVNAEAVREMDAELTRRATICFVASETLLDVKRALNERTVHSPHGVDVDHFAQARVAGPMPAELAGVKRPVIGFFGLIEEYIDLELIDFLGAERPGWTFVLIGRVAARPDRVPSRPNVLFTGPRPYESLPEYGRCFAAAIIPYRKTEFTFHANPLKLREYLAMGIPVVATRTPQTEQFAHVAAIVETRDAWLAALDRAVAERAGQGATEERMREVAPCSWEARMETVWAAVTDAMASRGSAAARGAARALSSHNSRRASAVQG